MDMIHIALDLTQTEFAAVFAKLKKQEGITALVKPKYLHVSLVIATTTETFSKADVDAVTRIANDHVANRVALLKNFKTCKYRTNRNGFLMLDLDFKGLNDIVADMESALKQAGFECICKRPLHSTLIKGGRDKAEVSTIKTLRTAAMGNTNLEAEICNTTFSLEKAVFAIVDYPRGPDAGDLAETVTIRTPLHRFGPRRQDELAVPASYYLLNQGAPAHTEKEEGPGLSR